MTEVNNTNKVKLIPERKKLWVDALNSGEFQQGQKALNNNDGMCCLGVACEVYRRETGIGQWKDYDDGDGRKIFDTGLGKKDYFDHNDMSWSSMPDHVAEWYGLDNEDDLITDIPGPYGGTNAHVIWLNDKLDYNFKQIAEAIDRCF